jgi:hypothetical protein
MHLNNHTTHNYMIMGTKSKEAFLPGIIHLPRSSISRLNLLEIDFMPKYLKFIRDGVKKLGMIFIEQWRIAYEKS